MIQSEDGIYLDQSTSTSLIANQCKHIEGETLSFRSVSLLSACSSPQVTLIPSTSNFSFPLQFRRTQDFYISSTVELNCNVSIVIQFKWLISNCSNFNCSNAVQFDSTVITTTTNELYISARTLPFGLYEVELTATLGVSSNLRSSKSAYVRINPSGITANLVQLGTSMITSGADQDLHLNPGLHSLDLDEEQFNASVNHSRSYSLMNIWVVILGLDLWIPLSHLWRVEFPELSRFINPAGRASWWSSRSVVFSQSIRYRAQYSLNSFCLNREIGNGSLPWHFNGVPSSLKSSLILLAGSLRSNRTYQMMVYMVNKRNSSLQGTGYLLVHVEQTFPQLIVIG